MKHQRRKLNTVRLLALFIVCSVLMGLAMFPASAAESGTCGDSLSWELNAGTLTITGSGAMHDYINGQFSPWYEFCDEIVRVEIADTVTSIGSFAFYNCTNLATVYIPNTVRSIGNYAFSDCKKMVSVQGASSVSSIGKGAFYNCFALEAIRLPYGLSVLGDQAFYRCESLRSISVPSDVRTMGESVFAYCKSLIRAEIYARIDTLPAWTFYGCAQLTDVHIADCIKDIDNFGFKKCDSLSTVYFEGSTANTEALKEQIVVDVERFASLGYISDGAIPESTTSGTSNENSSGTVTQINTTVLQNSKILVSYTVEQTHNVYLDKKGTYKATVSVTLEDNASWQQAADEVLKILSYINNTYSGIVDMSKTTVNLYMGKGVKLSGVLLNALMGRDIELVVIQVSGSSWKINCKDLEAVDSSSGMAEDKNYSHTIKEASADICEKLGTDDCYRLTFETSASQKAEVIVQLPPQTAVNTNAFLYQVDENGDCQRLQAVAVDNDGNAHFYIASVDTGYEYVIGLDVPGEDTKDVIIPDTMVTSGAISALERLENVEYVHMGRVYSNGVGYGGLTWILIGVLVGTTVLVGGIMLVFNKLKLAKKAKTKS